MKDEETLAQFCLLKLQEILFEIRTPPSGPQKKQVSELLFEIREGKCMGINIWS